MSRVRPGLWGVGSCEHSGWGHSYMRPFLTGHSLARVFQWSKAWIEVLTSDIWGIRGACKPTKYLMQICVCMCISLGRGSIAFLTLSLASQRVGTMNYPRGVCPLKRKEGHLWHAPHTAAPTHQCTMCLGQVTWPLHLSFLICKMLGTLEALRFMSQLPLEVFQGSHGSETDPSDLSSPYGRTREGRC